MNNPILPNSKRSIRIFNWKNSPILPNSKRSQMHMQEMAFMLVAVILFFVIVGLFIFAILFAQLKDSANQAAKDKTLSAIKNLANSPEFYCVGLKPNCVDSDKALALISNANYQKFWPFSKLEIIKLKAFRKKDSEMITCTIQNYPDCDKIVIYDQNAAGISYSSYIGLCRNELEADVNYQKCEIAKLVARTENIIPTI